jgi:hypothetical protein
MWLDIFHLPVCINRYPSILSSRRLAINKWATLFLGFWLGSAMVTLAGERKEEGHKVYESITQ